MTESVSVPDRSQPRDRDTVPAFAAALRDLRASAGDPTLAALSDRTGISKSVLSVAFAGGKLPTERTVLKVVAALGGEPAYWRARRDALDPRTRDPEGDQLRTSPGMKRFSITQTSIIAASAAVVAAVATSLVWGGIAARNTEADAANSVYGQDLEPANGVDPMRSVCRDDAVIAASEGRLDNQVHVQLMYSNDCMAVWGRVTRYDNRTEGNTMTMRVWPMDDPTSDRAQSRTDINLQSLYTPMIIEPDVAARVCGQATITVDGRTEDLGPKLCI